MDILSADWLKDKGVTGNPAELEDLSSQLREILEMRVGYAISDQLTDEQMEDFQSVFDETDDNDKEGLRIKWLDANYPGYRAVVKEQEKKLAAEVQAAKDKTQLINDLYDAEVPAD